MRRRKNFSFEYDRKNDVLSLIDYNKQIHETLEFNEFLNVDIDKKGEVAGLEIFDVSQFIRVFNKEVTKEFLINLENVDIFQKDYRNNIFIAIVLYSQGKHVQQYLPPLKKTGYISPLINSQ